MPSPEVKYVIWSCYPLVYALRSFEIITPWQEEAASWPLVVGGSMTL